MYNLKYSEILSNNKQLSSEKFQETFPIKILSNVTISAFKEILEYSLRLKSIQPVIEIGNFDNILQDSMHIGDQKAVFVFYDVLHIVDSISGDFESLSELQIQEIESKIRSEIEMIMFNLRNVPTLFFNTFSASAFACSCVIDSKLECFVDRLNKFLTDQREKNTVLVNIDKIVIKLGRNQAFDFRFYLSAKAPYSIAFFKEYINAIESTMLKVTGRIKKAVIFDCDNTLWEGIIGEDGIEKIQMSADTKLGKPYYDVQCIAKHLSRNGILIGLCSKNNKTDVDEVLLNHTSIVLKDEDIIVKQVNWDDKVSNLQRIAHQLNIGVDSLLFIDDSDYEINLINQHLPQVRTFQVPKEKYLYKNNLLDFLYTNLDFSTSGDDKKKTLQYKEQIQRESERLKFDSLEKYLSALKIRIEIHKNDPSHLSRVSQLTQKTNQFNLTTCRYTETEISQFLVSKNMHIYTASVSDRYGESGLTALCIVRLINESEQANIDTFLMSCRVIGRNIEVVFFEEVFKHLKSLGIKTITAKFIKTAKNEIVSKFYDTLNFQVESLNDFETDYRLDVDVYQPTAINYIEVKHS